MSNKYRQDRARLTWLIATLLWGLTAACGGAQTSSSSEEQGADAAVAQEPPSQEVASEPSLDVTSDPSPEAEQPETEHSAETSGTGASDEETDRSRAARGRAIAAAHDEQSAEPLADAPDTAAFEATAERRTDVESSQLRVVAWPASAEGTTYRALEERSGFYESIDGARAPWMFVFSMRNGAREISGLTLNLPAERGDASPPGLIYIGVSPTPVEVDRESFRSVLGVMRRVGAVDLSDVDSRRVYVAFEEPVRASLVVLQVSGRDGARRLGLNMVDVVGVGDEVPIDADRVATRPVEDESDAGASVLLVPVERTGVPDGQDAVDAMEQVGDTPSR